MGRFLGGKFLWCQISQRAVGSAVIILVSPAFDDYARFGKAGEDFTVQALVSEFIVKTFYIGLFPRGAKADIERLDLTFVPSSPGWLQR